MSPNNIISDQLADYYEEVLQRSDWGWPSINPGTFYSRGDPRVTLGALAIFLGTASSDSRDNRPKCSEHAARALLKLSEGRILDASGIPFDNDKVISIPWNECAGANFDLIDSFIWHDNDLKRGEYPAWRNVSFFVDQLQANSHLLSSFGDFSGTMSPLPLSTQHPPFPKAEIETFLEEFFCDATNRETRPGADSTLAYAKTALGKPISREPFRKLFSEKQPEGWSVGGRRKSRRK